MAWKLVGFDTETTGTDVNHDRIISAAVVTAQTKYTWLINPGVPIPEGASAVHGLTNEKVQSEGAPAGPALAEIAGVIATEMAESGVLVAYNAGYDVHILEAELARHGLKSLAQRLGGAVRPVLDPLVLDRKLDRYRKGKKKLENLIAVYGITPSGNLHDAAVDTQMTLSLAHAMLQRYPEIAQTNPQDLHDLQVQWHAEWAENFEQFMRSRGNNVSIERKWI
ncbi:MAG: exonuclease domain-containing protein [Actinomycetaceae bacterium]|nr:exonuclease domain-containing protein [Actinomycetaceae bacterium]